MFTGNPVRLRLPHMEMHGLAHGDPGGPRVIALHGWLDNAASFELLAPEVPEFNLVALDLAGHGLSSHRPPGGGYTLWDSVIDVVAAADALGWSSFSLVGHSLGAILSAILAAVQPERVERLVLIDGLMPFTAEADTAPTQLANAIRAFQGLPEKRKPIYAEKERAVLARMAGRRPVSRLAAEHLVDRGLEPAAEGFTWRTDARLTLPTTLRLTREQAMAFVRNVKCPTSLVLADDGILREAPDLEALCKPLPFKVHRLPGGHHLHLDDVDGARAVAGCIKALFASA